MNLFLRRWMLSGPENARIVQQFDSSFLNDNDPEHPKNYQNHEAGKAQQKTFQAQVNRLVRTIKNMGNPFVDDFPELVKLDSRDCVNPSVIESMKSLQNTGHKQYTEYKDAVLITRKKSIHDPIHKNNVPLFSKSNGRSLSNQQKKISFLQKNVSIFSQLYIAMQTRDGDMDDFFAHEVQPFPPSLSDDGNIRLPSAKSDLLKCLPRTIDAKPPNFFDCKVLDGAVVVHSLAIAGAITFDDYAEQVFIPHLLYHLQHTTRLDVVWDDYRPGSLKESTREKRGRGIRRKVGSHVKLPKNWIQFLRDNENKKELFEFLSAKVESFSFPDNRVVIITKGTKLMWIFLFRVYK